MAPILSAPLGLTLLGQQSTVSVLHIGHALTVVALHSGLLPSDVVPYAITRDVWQPALAECRVCVEDSFLPTHSSSPCTGIGALAGGSARGVLSVGRRGYGERHVRARRALPRRSHAPRGPPRPRRRPSSCELCVTPYSYGFIHGSRFS